MQKGQAARLDAYRRIQNWLDTRSDALGTVNKSTSRTDLDAAVTKVESDDAQQKGAVTLMTSRTKQKLAAREDLRLNHMQPIAMIAKKKLGTTPDIADMQLPRKNVSDAALIGKGAAMALGAAKYPQVFTDQQLPANFIDELNASIEALKQAVASRETAQFQLNETTKALKDQFTITHTDVKVLNALVVKQLKGKTDLLAAWRIAKRIKLTPGVPVGTTPPAAIPPAPTPPAPTPAPTPAPAPAPTPTAATLEVPQAA